jgi:excisionase family DNA binding protein
MRTDLVNSPRLSTAEAAQYLGVSLRTMERMKSDRLIPVQRITRRKHLIRQFDLDKYLERVTS